MVAVCADMPMVKGFRFEIQSGVSVGSSMIVEGFSGAWSTGQGWQDNTAALTYTGGVIYSGSAFAAVHHSQNSIPGYWFRFRFTSGLSSQTALTRVLFSAPCQPLTTIGDSVPERPICFIYWDDSEKSAKDFTSEVIDNSYPSFARLNDGSLENPVGMGVSDAIYVGFPSKFTSVQLTPHNDYRNRNTAFLTGEYWNGIQWATLPGFQDNTQEPSGKCLGKKGEASWTIPADWRQNRSISAQFPHGYWIRLKVSAAITAKTFLSEASITPVHGADQEASTGNNFERPPGSLLVER